MTARTFENAADFIVNGGMQDVVDINDLEDTVCTLCDYEYNHEGRTPVRLHCGHIFCGSCLRSWTENGNTCPFCRAELFRFNPAVARREVTDAAFAHRLARLDREQPEVVAQAAPDVGDETLAQRRAEEDSIAARRRAEQDEAITQRIAPLFTGDEAMSRRQLAQRRVVEDENIAQRRAEEDGAMAQRQRPELVAQREDFMRQRIAELALGLQDEALTQRYAAQNLERRAALAQRLHQLGVDEADRYRARFLRRNEQDMLLLQQVISDARRHRDEDMAATYVYQFASRYINEFRRLRDYESMMAGVVMLSRHFDQQMTRLIPYVSRDLLRDVYQQVADARSEAASVLIREREAAQQDAEERGEESGE